MEVETDENRLAHEILEKERGKLSKGGIAAIDLDEKRVIEVVEGRKTLHLLKRLREKYSGRRIYLLRTDAKSPVIWSR